MLIMSPLHTAEKPATLALGATASFCSSLMSCQASYFLSLRLFPKAATVCMCVCALLWENAQSIQSREKCRPRATYTAQPTSTQLKAK